MMSLKWRLVLLAGFVLLVGGLYWLQRDVVTLDRIVRQEIRLRTWIAEHGITAFAAGFVVYVLLSVIPGTGGKAVVVGWLYGFWQGLVIVDCALTVAALIAFSLSRYLFTDVVEARLGGVQRWLNEALEREGAFYLLTVRLLHVPYSVINYASGITSARVRTFWWTTQVGLLPGTIVCVLVGSRLPSLRELQQRGLWSLLDPLLVAGLVFTAVLPVIVRLGLARWRRMLGEAA